jgi:hypothetical protein
MATTVTLSPYAFIDEDYFFYMNNETEAYDDVEIDKIRNIINYITNLFEYFCGRKLKARDFYSYDEEDMEEEYAIFDPPRGEIFWFPTYPINSITSFTISGVNISEATDYDDTIGYFLYKKTGKLVYSYGFDYGYLKNIKVDWNGGYNDTHSEYAELQYLTYNMCSELWSINPGEGNLISETIGNYKWLKMSPKDLDNFKGLYPNIFFALSKYRKFYI